MHRSRASGKSPLPPLRHETLPIHAARYPSFNRARPRPPRCSDRGGLTIQSNSPFSRCAEVRATSSGTPRIASGSRTVPTVPSSLTRRVITDEQRWQSQKYSTRLDFDERSARSVSSRNSLPSARRRNEVEHKGFVHLASIATLLTIRPPQAAPAQACRGWSRWSSLVRLCLSF